MTFLEAVANAVADADAITVAPGQWQAACNMQHAAPCLLPACPLCVVVASANVAIAIALANVAKKQLAKFSTDRQ